MSVEQQVLGFQITVDDVVGMEVVERERDLGGVELCDWIWEALEIVSISMVLLCHPLCAIRT